VPIQCNPDIKVTLKVYSRMEQWQVICRNRSWTWDLSNIYIEVCIVYSTSYSSMLFLEWYYTEEWSK